MTKIPIPTSIPRAPAMRTQLTGCQISNDPFFHHTALICKGCGAPIDPISKHLSYIQCNFCGTTYIW